MNTYPTCAVGFGTEPWVDQARKIEELILEIPGIKIKLPRLPTKGVSAELLAWMEISDKHPRFQALQKLINIVIDGKRWKSLKPTRWARTVTPCKLLEKRNGDFKKGVFEMIDDYARDISNLDGTPAAFETGELIYSAAVEMLLPIVISDPRIKDIGALDALKDTGVLTDKEHADLLNTESSPSWETVLSGVKARK